MSHINRDDTVCPSSASVPVDRRGFLKIAGVAAAAAGGLSRLTTKNVQAATGDAGPFTLPPLGYAYDWRSNRSSTV